MQRTGGGGMNGQEKIRITVNPMKLTSITAFSNIFGRFHDWKKDVYFIRYIGFEGEKEYLEEIKRMDRALSERFADCGAGYLRLDRLEGLIPSEKIPAYQKLYQKRLCGEKELPFFIQDVFWQEQLEKAYQSAVCLYQKAKPQCSADMIKNFEIRLLYWIDCYFPGLYSENIKKARFPKLVCSGELKLQEYLFFYLLVQTGCDVLYLNPEKDTSVQNRELLELSFGFHAKNHGRAQLPAWPGLCFAKQEDLKAGQKTAKAAAKILSAQEEEKNSRQKVKISQEKFRRPDRENAVKGAAGAAFEKMEGKEQGCGSTARQEELPYEELAKFASSVVMIEGYNEQGRRIQSGSGVVMNREGYILTNFHVVSGACSYGVRLEEDEEIHETQSLVKYHPIYDLAILKIDKECKPIPVYRGEKGLVRGQKVVAIGSPLGLFNSVSDGIISGFRKMDDVSMIQFTAPISHGSSGGAVLDLYGNLIGISTAGFDDGQNLNLAVDYQTVLNFVRGFLKE